MQEDNLHGAYAAGFTMLELIMVIVILGILAAVATPIFGSLGPAARKGAVDRLAGNLGTANTSNVALCAVGTSCVVVANCTDATALAASFLAGGEIPAGYTISPQTISIYQSRTCTIVEYWSQYTASFTLTGTLASGIP
ncbi:MAG: prepilin-type N-terminal cleavage/methylation domain-containing protein [Magnetococcales bacterium]|nr:prepilin-type N-terminal cleavage/methylation domain-containing protein [Magnetococcales bacterium]